MLKVVKVQLHNGNRHLETYAVLDDSAERTIVLPSAVQQLASLMLRTVHQEVVQLKGHSVT